MQYLFSILFSVNVFILISIHRSTLYCSSRQDRSGFLSLLHPQLDLRSHCRGARSHGSARSSIFYNFFYNFLNKFFNILKNFAGKKFLPPSVVHYYLKKNVAMTTKFEHTYFHRIAGIVNFGG